MLINRLLEPGAEDLIYHYCSTSTFKAILDSGKIRTSDIAMLNDSQEALWGYSAFEEAATRLIKRVGLNDDAPRIELPFIEEIDKIPSPFQARAHPFVSCFSHVRDDLPQWRAYGDDGRGVAIGFNARDLMKSADVRLWDVIYDRECQIKEMMTAIGAMWLAWNERGVDVRQQDFEEDCAWLAVGMLAFKHHSFVSEQEIRALHLVSVVKVGQGIKFEDSVGPEPPQPVEFLVKDNHLVAFVDLPYVRSGTECCIKEVVLGPKNRMNPGNVLLYLAGLGYPDIAIRASQGSYR
ncbi:MAG: DUF2971 domain-containing protein [Panacagrimonas sp.]